MPYYRRARLRGGTYFFTVTLHDRRQRLLVDYVEHLRAAFREVRAKRPFAIDAIVIMPEHLHCVWTLPRDDDDFPTRWRLIKTRFTRAVPNGRIWQPRFWEHLIRNERDFETHVHYIHFNPVKHGHVSRIKEWPYSSFHRFVAAGVYSEDWEAPRPVRALERE